MKPLLTASFASAFMLASSAFAADPVATQRLIVEGTVVALKDGVVMEGKDGRKYLHKNDVVWQQISEKGTMAPNR